MAAKKTAAGTKKPGKRTAAKKRGPLSPRTVLIAEAGKHAPLEGERPLDYALRLAEELALSESLRSESHVRAEAVSVIAALRLVIERNDTREFFRGRGGEVPAGPLAWAFAYAPDVTWRGRGRAEWAKQSRDLIQRALTVTPKIRLREDRIENMVEHWLMYALLNSRWGRRFGWRSIETPVEAHDARIQELAATVKRSIKRAFGEEDPQRICVVLVRAVFNLTAKEANNLFAGENMASSRGARTPKTRG